MKHFYIVPRAEWVEFVPRGTFFCVFEGKMRPQVFTSAGKSDIIYVYCNERKVLWEK